MQIDRPARRERRDRPVHGTARVRTAVVGRHERQTRRQRVRDRNIRRIRTAGVRHVDRVAQRVTTRGSGLVDHLAERDRRSTGNRRRSTRLGRVIGTRVVHLGRGRARRHLTRWVLRLHPVHDRAGIEGRIDGHLERHRRGRAARERGDGPVEGSGRRTRVGPPGRPIESSTARHVGRTRTQDVVNGDVGQIDQADVRDGQRVGERVAGRGLRLVDDLPELQARQRLDRTALRRIAVADGADARDQRRDGRGAVVDGVGAIDRVHVAGVDLHGVHVAVGVDVHADVLGGRQIRDHTVVGHDTGAVDRDEVAPRHVGHAPEGVRTRDVREVALTDIDGRIEGVHDDRRRTSRCRTGSDREFVQRAGVGDTSTRGARGDPVVAVLVEVADGIARGVEERESAEIVVRGGGGHHARAGECDLLVRAIRGDPPDGAVRRRRRRARARAPRLGAVGAVQLPVGRIEPEGVERIAVGDRHVGALLALGEVERDDPAVRGGLLLHEERLTVARAAVGVEEGHALARRRGQWGERDAGCHQQRRHGERRGGA